MEEEIEIGVVETETKTREWQAIMDECISGGVFDDRCNLVATSHGKAEIEVIAKRLSCGCILVPADSEEIIL